MKSLLILLIFFLGCGSKEVIQAPTKASHKTPQVWLPVQYEDCDATPLPNVTLPYDIGLTIGHMELPHRYDNMQSMRAMLIKTDGTFKNIGKPLVNIFGQTTPQMGGFSADGTKIALTQLWEDPMYAMQEEADEAINPVIGAYRGNIFLYDVVQDTYKNLTNGSPSFYNSAGSFLPGSSSTILFSAFINESRPYVMGIDGSNKVPFASAAGFTYGASMSPDTTRYAFHSNYKIFIGNSSTGVETQVPNGCDYGFAPQWSADSQYIAFYCIGSWDIWIADRDGNNAKFVASKNGADLTIPFMEGYDFHGGGSDWLTWKDHSLIYPATVGDNTELLQTNIDTNLTLQLTNSVNGTKNNFPSLSRDGQYIAFTSLINNKRDLHIMNLTNKIDTQVTDMKEHCIARYPFWRP